MRLISTANCQPGMILARPVFSPNGTVLINTDMELNDSAIQRLKKLGVNTLYIKDPLTDDVKVIEPISDETRQLAIKAVRESFVEVAGTQGKLKGALSHQHLKNIKDSFDSMIIELKQNKEALHLLSNVYVNDHYVFTHSFQVTVYALAIGIEEGYNNKELYELGMGAMLHDIGKMKLPDEILHKAGPLTDEEFEVVKKHTVYGYDILRKTDNIPLISAHCALQHHERLNGSGYPRQLAFDQIHRHAKILAVADVYDALTSNRVYRGAVLPHKAMQILFEGMGIEYDSRIVDIFHSVVALYPIGMTVLLNTGETAVVVDYNRHDPSRPIVRIVTDPQGASLKEGIEIDLSRQDHYHITDFAI